MVALSKAADNAAAYLRGTVNEELDWTNLRFGLSMGMIPSLDANLPPSEIDRLTDMVLLRLGRPEERNI